MGAVSRSRERTMAHLEQFRKQEGQVIRGWARKFDLGLEKHHEFLGEFSLGRFLGWEKKTFKLPANVETDNDYEFFDKKDDVCFIVPKRAKKRRMRPIL